MTRKTQMLFIVGAIVALLLCSTGLFFATTMAIGQESADPDLPTPVITMTASTIVKIIGIVAGAIGTWSIILLAAIKWLIGRSVNNFDHRFDNLEKSLEQERNRLHDTQVDVASLDGRFVRKEDCRKSHRNLQERIDVKCNGINK